MPRLTVAAVIALGALGWARATRAQSDVILPENLDLSGIWVAEVAPPSREPVVIRRCDQQYAADSNWANLSRVWIELRAVKKEFTPGTRTTTDVWRLHYEGKLHYPQGYGSKEQVNGDDGKPLPFTWQYDHQCHVEDLEYVLSGHQTYLGPGSGITLELNAQLLGPPQFAHYSGGKVTHYLLGGAFPGTPTKNILFVTYEGDRIKLGTGLGPLQFRGITPGQCNIFLHYPAETYSISQCQPLQGLGLTFRRSTAPPEPPKLPIKGQLREAAPDGTPTPRAVPQGRIRLWRQASYLRDRKAGEDDAAYAQYRAAARAGWSLLAETTPDAMGRFTFRPVPVLGQAPYTQRAVYERVYYALEVLGAEKDETGPDGEKIAISFEDKIEPNVRAGDDRAVLMIPFEELGIKRSLSVQLESFCPNQWGPVEMTIPPYLFSIQNGTVPRTPAVREGVRRAIWGERASLMAARLADELLSLSLEALGDLLTDFIGSSLDTKWGPHKRLENLKEADNFAHAGEALPVFKTADFASLKNAIAELERSRLVKASEIYDVVMNAFKWGVAFPIKNGLLQFGLSDANASKLVELVERYAGLVLGSALKGNVGEVAKELLKQAITTLLKHELVDSELDAFPSFCGLTRRSLAANRDLMRQWSTANSDRYQQHRGDVVKVMKTMSDEATLILQAGAFARGIAEGTGAAADVYELGQANPAFRLAKVLAKATQRLSNAATFVTPPVYTFGKLRRAVDQACYASFGMTPPMTAPLTFTTTAPYDGTLWREFLAAHGAFKTAAGRLRSLLGTDAGLPQALVHYTDRGPNGFAGALAAMRRSMGRYLAHVSAVIGADPRLGEGVRTNQAAYADFNRMLQEVSAAVLRLYGPALLGELKGPTDPLLVASLARARGRLEDLERLLDGFANVRFEDGELMKLQVAPLARVEDLTVTSDASGAPVARTAGETFTVKARIVNLTSVPLSGLAARLEPEGTTDAIGISPATVTVGASGALAARDRMPGGPDEAEVTWKVTVPAADGRLAVGLHVVLTENGQAPTSFAVDSQRTLLLADPALRDRDDDGMPDHWEMAHGLDPTKDDSQADKDGDGLRNALEYRLGLDPGKADTDGDGLSDGEEVYGGEDGWVTNPRSKDTDGDGVPDGMDGHPTDGATAEKTMPPPEPKVALDVGSVVVNPGAERFVLIPVKNAGGGTLLWTADTDAPELISVSPRPGEVRREGDALVITSAVAGMRGAVPPVRVRVIDVSGATPDEAVVMAEVQTMPAPDAGAPAPVRDAGAPAPTPGVDAGVRRDGGIADAAGDAGGTAPDGSGGGCGCRVGSPGGGAPLGAVAVCLLAAVLLRRRRPRR